MGITEEVLIENKKLGLNWEGRGEGHCRAYWIVFDSSEGWVVPSRGRGGAGGLKIVLGGV